MKKQTMILAAIMVLIFATALYAADDKPWFDMKNCDFCKHLMEDPKLMENMCWNHYDISNGVMIVTTVKPEFQESYDKAAKAMEALGNKMMTGEAKDVKLCGHCIHYGMMMEKGAKFEVVKTDVGEISLITSDDPEVLKLIQEYSENNKKTMAEMEAAEAVKAAEEK